MLAKTTELSHRRQAVRSQVAIFLHAPFSIPSLNLFAFSTTVMAAPSMSCSSGGQFYACASGSRFVGCCSTDPCGTSSCPAGTGNVRRPRFVQSLTSAGNLLATSFDPASYDTFVDQQCSGGLFFTCANNDPPFWGCCKNDPCATGRCSTNDLAAAFLSGNALDAAPFLSLNGTVASSTFSTSQSTASASQSTSASDPSAMSSSHAPRTSTHVGAIVGGAVGGFAILAALIFSLLWLRHRRRDSKAEKRTDAFDHPLDTSFGAVKDPIGMNSEA